MRQMKEESERFRALKAQKEKEINQLKQQVITQKIVTYIQDLLSQLHHGSYFNSVNFTVQARGHWVVLGLLRSILPPQTTTTRKFSRPLKKLFEQLMLFVQYVTHALCRIVRLHRPLTGFTVDVNTFGSITTHFVG